MCDNNSSVVTEIGKAAVLATFEGERKEICEDIFRWASDPDVG
jgi:hypothetical protein